MPPKVELKSKTNGKNIKKFFDRTKPGAVKVGILKGLGEHPNATEGQTISEIAAYNEFGTGDIPERPFLRTTIMENKTPYAKLLKKLMGMLLEGTPVETAIGILGEKVAADVQAKIVEISEPANSVVTLAKKDPKTSPLIDTGTLRKSISWGEV